MSIKGDIVFSGVLIITAICFSAFRIRRFQKNANCLHLEGYYTYLDLVSLAKKSPTSTSHALGQEVALFLADNKIQIDSIEMRISLYRNLLIASIFSISVLTIFALLSAFCIKVNYLSVICV